MLREVIGFERSQRIQPRVLVVTVKLVEWLEGLVGALTSFPSAVVAGGETTPAVWIRWLKKARETPPEHSRPGNPSPDSDPREIMGFDDVSGTKFCTPSARDFLHGGYSKKGSSSRRPDPASESHGLMEPYNLLCTIVISVYQ